MMAISLWQPYASAIVAGVKTYETRHWSTKVRGEIAIHAAKRWTREESSGWDAYVEKFGFPPRPPLGAIIAVCNLVSVHPTEDLQKLSMKEQVWGDYGPERFGWKLENVRGLATPVPCVGRQSFWTVDDDIESAIRLQL